MGEKAYFIAIPTSSGTGSEVTPFAVITDEKTGIKYPLADYELLPKMAIIDADMCMDQPKGLTAASGIDAKALIVKSRLLRSSIRFAVKMTSLGCLLSSYSPSIR